MIQPPKQYKYTKKETAFCNFYADFHFKETFQNALKSYLAAGYKDTTAKRNSIMSMACRLLYKEKIKDYCAKIIEQNLNYRIKNAKISGMFADQELLIGICACRDPETGEITDKANHLGYVRLLQQRVGQLNEKLQIELTTAPQLQQAMQRELSDLAKLRCLLPGQESDNVSIEQDTQTKQIDSTVIDSVSTNQDSEIVSINDDSEIEIDNISVKEVGPELIETNNVPPDWLIDESA